jgi:hypothetical protein
MVTKIDHANTYYASEYKYDQTADSHFCPSLHRSLPFELNASIVAVAGEQGKGGGEARPERKAAAGRKRARKNPKAMKIKEPGRARSRELKIRGICKKKRVFSNWLERLSRRRKTRIRIY